MNGSVRIKRNFDESEFLQTNQFQTPHKRVKHRHVIPQSIAVLIAMPGIPRALYVCSDESLLPPQTREIFDHCSTTLLSPPTDSDIIKKYPNIVGIVTDKEKARFLRLSILRDYQWRIGLWYKVPDGRFISTVPDNYTVYFIGENQIIKHIS